LFSQSLQQRASATLRSLVKASAVVAVTALAAQSAWATHFSQPVVDSIDGSGPGVFGGALVDPDTANWYTFFADGTSGVTVQTTAASFDTFLTLYLAGGVPAVGDLRSAYTQIAANDDGGGGLLSLISLGTLAAGNYVVAVEQFGGGGGSYTLAIRGNVAPIGTVPEPGSLALVGLALAGVAAGVRRSSAAAAR
jgi:hypothetical protein